jgi:hypothetical protein
VLLAPAEATHSVELVPLPPPQPFQVKHSPLSGHCALLVHQHCVPAAHVVPLPLASQAPAPLPPMFGHE